MKILETLRGMARGLREWAPARWPGMGQTGSGGFASNRLQLPGISQPSSNVLWVYNCVTARSEAIRQVPLRISDDAGNLMEAGPLFDLLAQPNGWQDTVQFVGEIEAFATVYNEFFILPVGEGDGSRPTELVPLCPRYMQPIRGVHVDSGRQIAVGWEYRDPFTGALKTFRDDQLISVVSPNPDNPLRGLNPMGPLKATLLMDVGTREANLSLFANGAVQNFALATDQPWTKDQAKEFLESYQDAHSGVQRWFTPDIFYGGLKPVTLGLKPEELQSLEVLLRLTPIEIAAGLRVKPAMVGLQSGETGLSGGSSGMQQKQGWWSETGLSELARIAGALQQFVIDRFDWSGGTLRNSFRAMRSMERAAFGQWQRMARSHSVPLRGARAAGSSARRLMIWFDPDGIPELVEAKRARVEQADKVRLWGHRPDDINEYFDLGLPPHPTNQGIVPVGVQAVEDVAVGGSVPAPRGVPSSELPVAGARCAGDVIGDIEAILGRAADDEAGRAVKKNQRIQKAFEAVVAPQEKAAARKWSRYYTEQRGRVLDRMKKAEREFTAENAKTTKRDGERVELTPEELLKRVFPRDDENSFLLARLTPLWTSQLQAGWEHLHKQDLGNAEGLKAHPFAIEDPRIAEALEARKLQGVSVNETTENILRKVFADGIEAGDTLDELAGRVADYYNQHAVGEEKGRPLTAARTQTAGIVNDGRLAAAREAGGLLKFWIHGTPEEPREAHIDAETKYTAAPIALDARFIVNGVAMQAPGDAAAPVSETANCTCGLGFKAA